MYLGKGYAWAKQSPPIPEPRPTCDCGYLKKPSDFLCHKCREEFEAESAAQLAEDIEEHKTEQVRGLF